ncbi:MAG: sugar phosphate nucleotidyltransferase [Candidatus Hodarchaeota archaeon]
MDKSPKRRTSITLPAKLHDLITKNAKTSRSGEIVNRLLYCKEEYGSEEWASLMDDWKPNSKEKRQQSYLSPPDSIYNFLDTIKAKTRLDRSQIVEFLLSYSYGTVEVPVRAIIVLGGKGIHPVRCPKAIPEHLCKSSWFIFEQNIQNLYQNNGIKDFLIIFTKENAEDVKEGIEEIKKKIPNLKGNIELYEQRNPEEGEGFLLREIFESHFFVRKAHTIFVMWGNVFVPDFDLRKFLNFHLKRKGASSLFVLNTDPYVNKRGLDPNYYSHVAIQGHEIIAFYPKPVPKDLQTNMLDIGIYLFHRNFFLEAIEKGFKESPNSRLRDIFAWYPKARPNRIFAYPQTTIWFDPGVILEEEQIMNNQKIVDTA